MPNPEQVALIERLAALLEEERQAVLEFDIDTVTLVAERKAALLDELKEAPLPDSDEMTGLRATALRNQELLDKAMEGIQAVADRVGEIRRVRSQLDTYDDRGQKTTILTGQSSVERRA